MGNASRSFEWHERLEAARTAADVVEACHGFVSLFAPSLLAQLPKGCLPPMNLDAATVSDYAVTLVRKELDAGAGASPVLSAFALFFTDAAQAFARIAMARKRPDLFPSREQRQ
jgi:hypothetical protein